MLSVEEMMAVFISMTLSAAYGSVTATAASYRLVMLMVILIRNKTSAILKPQNNINRSNRGCYKNKLTPSTDYDMGRSRSGM